MKGSVSPYLIFSTIPLFHQGPPDFPSPKCCLGADGVQYPRHALSPEPLFAGGSLCLYIQDEPKREVQSVHSFPLPPTSDGASRFEQGRDEGTHPCFWSLEWSI